MVNARREFTVRQAQSCSSDQAGPVLFRRPKTSLALPLTAIELVCNLHFSPAELLPAAIWPGAVAGDRDSRSRPDLGNSYLRRPLALRGKCGNDHAEHLSRVLKTLSSSKFRTAVYRDDRRLSFACGAVRRRSAQRRQLDSAHPAPQSCAICRRSNRDGKYRSRSCPQRTGCRQR